MRMQKARQRMMAAVPTADVVVTNPTHFAVAMKYDAASGKAPVVVAKGADFVAANIRKLAEEHKVPVVRNPPLARALYDTVDIDHEIPAEHYRAVAEVITFVYKLKGKKLNG
jgi:flagellar biosynthetic protein FlhB